jgi:hypothetical protein
MFLEKIKEMQSNYGDTFLFENPFDEVLFDGGDRENVRQRYAARQFLFMHMLFAFEKLEYLKILTLGNNWNLHHEGELRHSTRLQLLPSIHKLLGIQASQENLYFDEDKSRLFIKGREIKVRKFSDQYHTLRIIFSNKEDIGQEWFFSDIAEKIDEAKINEKRYYNAIYQVGQKARGEGFSDFFITTRQSVKINPKYLS